jgi:hypothetical protein
VLSFDIYNKNIKVELNEESRRKPLGEWDGETPRRFELDEDGLGELEVDKIQEMNFSLMLDVRLISSC